MTKPVIKMAFKDKIRMTLWLTQLHSADNFTSVGRQGKADCSLHHPQLRLELQPTNTGWLCDRSLSSLHPSVCCVCFACTQVHMYVCARACRAQSFMSDVFLGSSPLYRFIHSFTRVYGYLHVCLCTTCVMPVEARRRYQIPQDWS